MEPFLGEIRLFSMGFAPKGWMACEGQLLSLTQNVALFSILGTTYGGDGKTNFNLPDLRGRVPIESGTTYVQGKADGEATHVLLTAEMPAHFHVAAAASGPVNTTSPAAATWGNFNNGYSATANAPLNPAAIASTGQGLPHPNMQPYLAMNFCIATVGIYPSRS